MFGRLDDMAQMSEFEKCCPRPYCERCTLEDEKQILISVNPKILSSFKDHANGSKMVIRNRNVFTVFFKICSTNVDAFVPNPTSGRISPHGKVTVTIPFSTSATPIREHEEVIILASMRPFFQIDEKLCRYCYESHSPKQKSQACPPQESCMEKLKSDQIPETKMAVVCKYCNYHIARKDMRSKELPSLKEYRRYSGKIADHNCAHKDNILNEDMEARKEAREKVLYKPDKEQERNNGERFRTELTIPEVVEPTSEDNSLLHVYHQEKMEKDQLENGSMSRCYQAEKKAKDDLENGSMSRYFEPEIKAKDQFENGSLSCCYLPEKKAKDQYEYGPGFHCHHHEMKKIVPAEDKSAFHFPNDKKNGKYYTVSSRPSHAHHQENKAKDELENGYKMQQYHQEKKGRNQSSRSSNHTEAAKPERDHQCTKITEKATDFNPEEAWKSEVPPRKDIANFCHRKPHIRARVLTTESSCITPGEDGHASTPNVFKGIQRTRFISEKKAVLYDSSPDTDEDDSECSTCEMDFEKCSKRSKVTRSPKRHEISVRRKVKRSYEPHHVHQDAPRPDYCKILTLMCVKTLTLTKISLSLIVLLQFGFLYFSLFAFSRY